MHETESRIIDLLKDLILVRSTADNPDGLRHGLRLIRSHVEDLPGIQVHRYESGGKPSFVALPKGCDQADTLLVAHVDVVAAHESQFYPVVQERRLYGRGAGDMKGQIAILVELFKNIMQRHPGTPLGLMITTDEESGGEHGCGYLLGEQGVRCGQAIIPDSGRMNEIIGVEKGLISGRVVSTGHAGHSARPWYGENAAHRLIRNLNRVINHFDKLMVKTDHNGDDHWHSTLSVNILNTENRTLNRVPDSAEATLDVRHTEHTTAEQMIDQINALFDPHTRFIADIIAEPLHTQIDPAFIAVTEAVTGKSARVTKEHGGSDGRYFTRHNIPVLMSRPELGGLHSDDEWIDIDSMVTYYRILNRYLSERYGLD